MARISAMTDSRVTALVPGPGQIVVGGASGSVKRALVTLPAGPRASFLGDSITVRNMSKDIDLGQAGQAGSQDYWAYGAIQSQGRLRIGTHAMAGVGGDTTALALARMDTDVIANHPDICVVLLGANDVGGGVPVSTIAANLTTIYTKLRDAGIAPVACTMTPRGSPNTTVTQVNQWITRYGSLNTIPVADFYAVTVDPAANGWLSGYTSDGLHPIEKGAIAMGNELARAIGHFPQRLPYLTAYKSDQINLLANGVFVGDANSDGIADSWGPSGTPTATFVRSLVAGSDIGMPGNWQRTAVTVAGSSVITAQGVAGFNTAWKVGDRLALSGRVRTTGAGTGGLTITARITFNTTSNTFIDPVESLIGDVNGVFSMEQTVPATTTSATAYLMASTGTGTVDFGQVTLINLTTLGWA